jgi:hypothetical protein
MAIKLSGSVSRKVPIPGLDFSSQSYSAGMEIEINSADANEVRAQLAQLYASLNQGIDEQVNAASQAVAPQKNAIVNTATARSRPVSQSRPAAMPASNGYSNGYGRNRLPAQQSNGNGNGRRITATEALAKCIYAICKAQGLDMISVLADYNVSDPRDLPIKDASRVIDELKSKQATNGAGH